MPCNFACSGLDAHQPPKPPPPPKSPLPPPRQPRPGTAVRKHTWQQHTNHSAIRNRHNVQNDTSTACRNSARTQPSSYQPPNPLLSPEPPPPTHQQPIPITAANNAVRQQHDILNAAIKTGDKVEIVTSRAEKKDQQPLKPLPPPEPPLCRPDHDQALLVATAYTRGNSETDPTR